MSAICISHVSVLFVCHSVIVLISSSITFRSTECGGQRDDPHHLLGWAGKERVEAEMQNGVLKCQSKGGVFRCDSISICGV